MSAKWFPYIGTPTVHTSLLYIIGRGGWDGDEEGDLISSPCQCFGMGGLIKMPTVIRWNFALRNLAVSN